MMAILAGLRSGRVSGDHSQLAVIGSGTGLARRGLRQFGGVPVQGAGIFASDGSSQVPQWRYLGGLDRLGDVLASGVIGEASVCLDPRDWGMLERIARTCDEHGVPISLRLDVDGHRADAGAKRAIDILGATLGLLLLAPVFAALSLLILVADGRPVLFRQARAGLGGSSFHIAKFRTMQRDADPMRRSLRDDNEVQGAAFKMEDDPRVTRLGRWLRRTSLDELPQLWNVLKGEMSLVGPRPHPYDDVARYEPWHLRRLAVKPGMTGLWQVELRGEPDFDRWVAKDLEYIERSSIRLDIQILLRTVPAVVRGSGR